MAKKKTKVLVEEYHVDIFGNDEMAKKVAKLDTQIRLNIKFAVEHVLLMHDMDVDTCGCRITVTK